MREFADGRSYTFEFENINEMVEYGATPSKIYGMRGCSRDGQSGFRGTSSLEEAGRLATRGWPEGGELAKKYATKLFAVVGSQIEQPRYLYDVEGSDFDMSRVIAGEPEPWLQEYHEIVPAPGRVITIVNQICCSGGIPKETIMARGSVVAALVMLLEYAGHPVELIARNDPSALVHVIVKVKRAGQLMNLDEVAFAVAHPSMIRRLCFAVEEHAPAEFNRMVACQGHGMPCDAPVAERGDLYMPSMMYGEDRWMREDQSVKWILENLRAHGVKIEGK